jgi:hypothetical protein
VSRRRVIQPNSKPCRASAAPTAPAKCGRRSLQFRSRI